MTTRMSPERRAYERRAAVNGVLWLLFFVVYYGLFKLVS